MSSTKSDTRSRILDSAWRLLEARPGAAARMADIAKAAGISRQALYLHFPKRADLLVATTRHIDEVKNIDARLAASRTAATGRQRLDAFIEAWGGYIPEISGVARALTAMQARDDDARTAWADRMDAVRQGCQAAVEALDRDGELTPDLGVNEATDLLWTLLSVANWERLTVDRGWSQGRYVAAMKLTAQRTLAVPV